MSDEIKITPGQGLFQQLQKTNVHPYTKFSLEGIQEIMDEWAVDAWRARLRLILFRLENVFTDEEKNIVYNMINSDDQHNIYMAEQILNFKENEK